ncbi:MAG TPA: hypothetical protein VN516_08940, partial [Candidatus Baltobacteraceae bacterium]|nr:hypothetical protein [Candidatus Baltobacteraceae bacterium]
MAQIIFALLAGFSSVPNIFAQDEQWVDSRFLFIFSTSAEMKSRIQPTQTELNQILAFGVKGELHIGDSMGVWTFDREP